MNREGLTPPQLEQESQPRAAAQGALAPFREKIEKFANNVIPDLRDNFPRLSRLKSWEASDSESDPTAASRVKQKFLSREQHDQFLSALEFAQEGELYEHTWLVGSKEAKTLHPHTFLAEKGTEGFNLFFIDPEHNVGNQNFFRPKISNLISMRVAEDYSESEINIIRFNVDGIPPEQLKLQQQFMAARELLEKGEASLLAGHSENILFQAMLKPESAMIHARYTNERKAADFLAGGHGSRALRGKVKANEAILNRFVNYLQAGKFEKSKRFN